MQSFFQYRRFGSHVERQYHRDKRRAEVLRNDENESVSSSSESPDTLQPQTVSSTGPTDTMESVHDQWQCDPEKVEHQPQSNTTTSGQPAQVEVAHGGPSEGDSSRGQEESEQIRRAITAATMQGSGNALGPALTGIDVRGRKTNEKGGSGGDGIVFVVGYEGEKDILNPHNWSKTTRIAATMNIAAVGWIVGFASSADSAALVQASADFGVSDVTESLATGVYLIGFGVGALFAGPFSETVGRNPVYIATLTLYMVFIMASALAPNIGAQLAFRFLAGCFASTPLTCAGGSISDLWSSLERVYAFPVFANAAFMGPIFGPVVGGFIGESKLVSWRWTEWVTLIISGLVLVSVAFFQPETYAPILLKWKAKRLRLLTGDDRYKAEVEIRDETFARRLGRSLYRPFLLTFSEPIIILVALYLTVIYIILFTFLTGYSFIFTETYGLSEGITGLCFLGIAIGLCLASLLVPLLYYWAKRDLAKIEEQGGSRLPPEFRLWFAMFGAPTVPISLFWMGWTTNPSISFWSPLAASVLFGYGILCVFISSYQYVIDSYEGYAASALASVTLVRYVAAGGMVEVATPMYRNLGVPYTLTILACLSAVMVPVPYLFYFFGPQIRKRSKYGID